MGMGNRGALGYDDAGKGNFYLPVDNLLDATMGSYNHSKKEWRYTPDDPINFRLNVGFNLIKLRPGLKVQMRTWSSKTFISMTGVPLASDGAWGIA